MRKLLPVTLFILLLSTTQGYTQTLFPEKFTNCATQRFALESDTPIANIDKASIISTIISSIDEKIKNKLSGVLALQVLVDIAGHSCLLSVKNDTNINTKRLKLKETVDNKLVWEKPPQRVSAIIILKFDADGITVKRLGMSAEKGMHELM